MRSLPGVRYTWLVILAANIGRGLATAERKMSNLLDSTGARE
jgi:hypothetical protein